MQQGGGHRPPAQGCAAAYLQDDLESFQPAMAQKGKYFSIKSYTFCFGHL